MKKITFLHWSDENSIEPTGAEKTKSKDRNWIPEVKKTLKSIAIVSATFFLNTLLINFSVYVFV